jgi:nitrate reductase NapAB chaperone NapD
MKILFEDKSYIEIKRSDEPGKILIVVSAKDNQNPLKRITNAAEITEDEFNKLVNEVVVNYKQH